MQHSRTFASLAAVAVVVGGILSPVMAETFDSPKGYTITAPDTWKVNSSGVMGTDVVFLAKPVDGFSANVNVVIVPASPGDTIDSGIAQIKSLYPHTFTNYHSVALKRGKLAGEPAIFNVGVYTSGDKRLRMRQALVIRNGSVFTFTCTAKESSHAAYDPEFTKILLSVHWK